MVIDFYKIILSVNSLSLISTFIYVDKFYLFSKIFNKKLVTEF